MTYRKGRTNWKQFIAYFAIGSIAARLIIPIAYFESFHFITYSAIAMEGIILLMELGLVLLVLWRAENKKNSKTVERRTAFLYTKSGFSTSERSFHHPCNSTRVSHILLCVCILDKETPNRRKCTYSP